MREGGGIMKHIRKRISAMIGILLSLWATFLFIRAALYELFPELLYDGSLIYEPWVTAFYSLLSGVLIASFSLLFYGIDALIAAPTILKVMVPVNICLAVCIIFFFYKNALIFVWLAIYFITFTLEVVSLFRPISFFKQKQRRP